jgi:(p)ppGpp synthase/HD superfamily hydrolase
MTDRFNRALQLAIEAHAGQVRKGTENAVGLALPYITHPVAVAALVQRYGGTEDQVIAALLHDVLEDGGPQWARPIREAFGAEVLELVEFCTDGLPDETGRKPPWRERKEAYLEHLREADGPGLLVSACDKLANLQAILLDLTEVGEAVWARFTGKKAGTLWYYSALVEAFAGRVPVALEQALRRDCEAVMARAAPSA